MLWVEEDSKSNGWIVIGPRQVKGKKGYEPVGKNKVNATDLSLFRAKVIITLIFLMQVKPMKESQEARSESFEQKREEMSFEYLATRFLCL